jgi:hypothetical protein
LSRAFRNTLNGVIKFQVFYCEVYVRALFPSLFLPLLSFIQVRIQGICSQEVKDYARIQIGGHFFCEEKKLHVLTEVKGWAQ